MDIKPSLSPQVDARKGSAAIHHAGAVRAMFDRISPSYDLLNRLLSLGIDRSWREQAITRLLEGLPSGPIADLCAGTLDLSAGLERALAGDSRPLLGIDFASEMLARGQGKVSARTKLVVGDSMALPLASGSMAGLICGFGFRNLADPVQGISEAYRCLKPGGTLVVLEFFRPVRLDTRIFHRAYASAVLPTVGSLVSGDKQAYRYLAASMQGFLSKAEFMAAMSSAGFVHVDARDLTLGVAAVVRGRKPLLGVSGPATETDADAVLACPQCLSRLHASPTGKTCEACQLSFAQRDGILNLVSSDATAASRRRES